MNAPIRTFLCLAILLTLIAPPAFPAIQGPPRVGLVDVETVSSKANLVRFKVEETQHEIDRLQKDLEREILNYQEIEKAAIKQSAVMSEKQMLQEEANLKARREKIGKMQIQIGLKIRETSKTVLQPAMNEIYKAIQSVARDKGISIVLRREMVLYADPAVDLTDAVIEYMNQKFTEGSSKKKKKSDRAETKKKK